MSLYTHRCIRSHSQSIWTNSGGRVQNKRYSLHKCGHFWPIITFTRIIAHSFSPYEVPQPADGVVLTKAGNLLNIKHIVQMVGQTSEKGISSSMYKALTMCEENHIQSVSFPALGTGKFMHLQIQMSKVKTKRSG